ncbi:MAG: hypothetical protein C5B51_19125 [Terriglobia bacterium]|nr:MAG: hypothetical protein C5B51_19125 [Terriglobia bacterium]
MIATEDAFFMKWNRILAVMAGFSVCAAAQSPPARPSSVHATGEAVVQAKPDQAKLDIGVVTQAATAQAAAAQNATQLQAVLEKLRAAVGASGDIRTAFYSLNPNYQYPRDGGKPTINGYTASNSVEVTVMDLTGLGKIIDAASQSGANSIQGPQFSIKNEAPVRAQALRQAVQDARANAEAMAGAMGMKPGRVLQLEQGSPEIIRPLTRQAPVAMAAQAVTPVEPGTIEVRATVTLTLELQ